MSEWTLRLLSLLAGYFIGKWVWIDQPKYNTQFNRFPGPQPDVTITTTATGFVRFTQDTEAADRRIASLPLPKNVDYSDILVLDKTELSEG